MRSTNSPASNETPPTVTPGISLTLNANAKKKRLEVKDIFNNDEDSEEINGPKRRKLVPLGKSMDACFHMEMEMLMLFLFSFLMF